ncbi:hypothetical protein KR074_011970 [Drosophila pseudoananassae]|nr:hypothetical protein KR074_011970 [Drosophila pseudoananassae]
MPEVVNAVEMEAPSEVVDMSPSGELTVNVITIINTETNNNNSNNNNNNNHSHSVVVAEVATETETEIGASEVQEQVAQLQQQPSSQLLLQPASNFVAIPLLERRRRSRTRSRSHSRCLIAPLAPIICLPNGSHPEDLAQLSRSRSCFLRFRRTFVKFFGKIMGSNNPSEADRYDYYDCE